MDLIRAVKGMNDLFPDELALWQQIENTAREVFKNFGFGEIRTPILENLKLFVRSVGEGTDIVEKEMYTLTDKDDSLLCLRPENTASVVRALIEKKFFEPKEIIEMMEKVKKERYRLPDKDKKQ